MCSDLRTDAIKLQWQQFSLRLGFPISIRKHFVFPHNSLIQMKHFCFNKNIEEHCSLSSGPLATAQHTLSYNTYNLTIFSANSSPMRQSWQKSSFIYFNGENSNLNFGFIIVQRESLPLIKRWQCQHICKLVVSIIE